MNKMSDGAPYPTIHHSHHFIFLSLIFSTFLLVPPIFLPPPLSYFFVTLYLPVPYIWLTALTNIFPCLSSLHSPLSPSFLFICHSFLPICSLETFSKTSQRSFSPPPYTHTQTHIPNLPIQKRCLHRTKLRDHCRRERPICLLLVYN